MTVQGNETFISGGIAPPFHFLVLNTSGGMTFCRKVMRGSAPCRRSRPTPCWARGIAERACYSAGVISRMGKRRPSSVIRVKRVPLWTIRSQRVLPVTKVVQATPSSFNS